MDNKSTKPSSILTPYLICKGAAEVIDFYKQAFGATRTFA